MKTSVRTLTLAMVACCLVVAVARAPDDPNDPAAPHEPGLYFYSEAGGEKKMTKIEPTSYGKTKQGFAFFGVYGQQTKQKAVIEGGHASLQVAERRPTFYFYFGTASAGLGENANLSPDEYVLSLMDVKDSGKTRRLVVGKSGFYGGKSGADKHAVRNFASEKIAPGVFKATVEQDLADGEYCFFRPIAGAGTIFDFGVKSGEPLAKKK